MDLMTSGGNARPVWNIARGSRALCKAEMTFLSSNLNWLFYLSELFKIPVKQVSHSVKLRMRTLTIL